MVAGSTIDFKGIWEKAQKNEISSLVGTGFTGLTGFKTSDDRFQVVTSTDGKTEWLTRDQLVNKGFINQNDVDIHGVRRFSSFTEQFPATTKDLSGAFENISKGFENIVKAIEVRGPKPPTPANNPPLSGDDSQTITAKVKRFIDDLKTQGLWMPVLVAGGLVLFASVIKK